MPLTLLIVREAVAQAVMPRPVANPTLSSILSHNACAFKSSFDLQVAARTILYRQKRTNKKVNLPPSYSLDKGK